MFTDKMNKKRNKKTNVGRPIAFRLSAEDDNTLVTLADAAGVSPGVLTREYMSNLLRNFKSIVKEGGQA